MNWEVIILQNLQSVRTPFLNSLMQSITIMAESIFILLIIAIIYWCLDKKIGTKIAWIVIFNGVVNGVIKNIMRMPRPFERGVVLPLRVETATSYSFPSGHTQTATSFWTSAVLIFKSKSMLIMAVIMSLLTAFSRVYLGVHWPIDVFAGLILGAVWAIIADKIFDPYKGFTKIHLILASVIFGLTIFLPTGQDLANTTSCLLGLVAGCIIEKKYVQFEEKSPPKQQFIKIFLGVISTGILYAGLQNILPELKICEMIINLIVIIWIVAGVPYLFKKFLATK
ncbi:MAG: hypothetical protein ATN36_08620 [Epulopiscium sp. Nele67-Bin005]|nr:MAG: hypothetical protein ATN36_08620 [Epulopiscium sp. Nele67-Bin005]